MCTASDPRKSRTPGANNEVADAFIPIQTVNKGSLIPPDDMTGVSWQLKT
jgi:hypothetical protein